MTVWTGMILECNPGIGIISSTKMGMFIWMDG